MTIERMIELLEIEHECMLRGAHDDCDRKCADCELVQEDDELHEMYTNVVWLLKEQEARWVEDKQGEHCRLIKCSKCGLSFVVGNNIPYDEWIVDRNYCRRCGARMVKQQ